MKNVAIQDLENLGHTVTVSDLYGQGFSAVAQQRMQRQSITAAKIALPAIQQMAICIDLRAVTNKNEEVRVPPPRETRFGAVPEILVCRNEPGLYPLP